MTQPYIVLDAAVYSTSEPYIYSINLEVKTKKIDSVTVSIAYFSYSTTLSSDVFLSRKQLQLMTESLNIKYVLCSPFCDINCILAHFIFS